VVGLVRKEKKNVATEISDIDFDYDELVDRMRNDKVEVTVSLLHVLLSYYYTGGSEPDSLNERLQQALEISEIQTSE